MASRRPGRSCRTRWRRSRARPRRHATHRASRCAPTASSSTLLAQLRTRGTWAPDVIGMKSAARQAFSLWTYQQLLPSMYSRYAVTGCADVDLVACGDLPDGDVRHGQEQGGRDLDRADEDQQAVLGLCRRRRHDLLRLRPEPGTLPDDIGDVVWGGTQPGCMYTPGQASTEWTYDCRLGVPLGKTVAADSPGWTFATTTGAPVIVGGGIDVRVSAVRVHLRPAPECVRPAPGRIRPHAARPAPRTALPRPDGPAAGAAPARAPASSWSGRCFEHGGREELARKRSGWKLRSLTLRRVHAGVFRSHGAGGPSVRLELRRGQTGRTRFDCGSAGSGRATSGRSAACCRHSSAARAGRSSSRRACGCATATRRRGSAPAGAGAARGTGKGEFDGIRLLEGKARAARPGLSVGMKAPRPLPSGSKATVRLTVTNKRRKGKRRIVSSLATACASTGFGGAQPRTAEIRELRAGRSRVVRLTVPVTPRGRQGVRAGPGRGAERPRGHHGRWGEGPGCNPRIPTLPQPCQGWLDFHVYARLPGSHP